MDNSIPLSPNSLQRTLAERQQRREAADELGVAPCPWCGHRLVAMVDGRGVYWFCLCVRLKRTMGRQAPDIDVS